jgi:hypothetical protein
MQTSTIDEININHVINHVFIIISLSQCFYFLVAIYVCRKRSEAILFFFLLLFFAIKQLSLSDDVCRYYQPIRNSSGSENQ